MRVLVLTACTGEKAVSDPKPLTPDDFRQGPAHVAAREQAIGKLTAAEDLYTGLQHQRLMQGVRALREQARNIQLDLYILSAGYGLVPSDRPLAPYEATFSGMRKQELRDWAKQLQIPQSVRALLAEPYDFGLVLLGNEYLDACLLASDVTLGGPTLLFCGLTKAKSLPELQQLRTIPLGNADAKRFSCGLIGLKGDLAARILRRLPTAPQLRTQLCDPARNPLDLLDDPSPTKPAQSKARPKANVDRVKLLAVAQQDGGGWHLRVAPRALDASHPLAQLGAKQMGIVYHTDISGILSATIVEETPLPTASAVLRDVVDILTA